MPGEKNAYYKKCYAEYADPDFGAVVDAELREPGYLEKNQYGQHDQTETNNDLFHNANLQVNYNKKRPINMGSSINTDGGNHLPLIIKRSNSIVVPDFMSPD